jgi:steroid delta-isomerase-like uncharacterized protein
MSAEENKALYRRFFEEALNQGNLRTVEELIAPDYVNYSFPGVPRGPEGMKQVISLFRMAFPNIQITPEQVFAEGDTVIGRGSWEGTHQGAFQGVPPSGARVKVPYMDIWRIEDGKFVENWVQMDMLGLMQQVGAFSLPIPPQGFSFGPWPGPGDSEGGGWD